MIIRAPAAARRVGAAELPPAAARHRPVRGPIINNTNNNKKQ